MDKFIEIARFKDANGAQILLSVLRAENIACNLKNETVNQVIGAYGGFEGVGIEVAKADVPRALEVLKEGGYESYTPENVTEQRLEKVSSFTDKIPFINKLPREFRFIFMIIIVALLITIVLYLIKG